MNIKSVLLIGLAVFISACGDQRDNGAATQRDPLTYEWRMVTSWPRDFPGFGQGAEQFADLVRTMSAGRMTIKVYGAGELVNALDVFDVVSAQQVEMGHSVSFYWMDKIPGAAYFTSIPFGMTSKETMSWLNFGGGLQLWQALYEPFNVVPIPGGGSDFQFGGWFNKTIDSIDDFKDLKIRMPGIGGLVLEKMGATPVRLSGGDLFVALKTGKIDAAEWVGPYNDIALGLHQTAKYYYFPGWQEPGTTLEFLINKTALDSLPVDLQAIILAAASVVNSTMVDEYVARNVAAFNLLTEQHGVDARAFPPEVLQALKEQTREVLNEQIELHPEVKAIHHSYMNFIDELNNYAEVSFTPYMQQRH